MYTCSYAHAYICIYIYSSTPSGGGASAGSCQGGRRGPCLSVPARCASLSRPGPAQRCQTESNVTWLFLSVQLWTAHIIDIYWLIVDNIVVDCGRSFNIDCGQSWVDCGLVDRDCGFYCDHIASYCIILWLWSDCIIIVASIDWLWAI